MEQGLAMADGESPSIPSVAIDEISARIGGYYLGRRHGHIHRHQEKVVIAPDQTAVWRLTIDLELPNDPQAQCGRHDSMGLFLFPLLFLKKAEGRTGFGARFEDGTAVPLPNRGTCDWVSAIAAATAAERVAGPQAASGGATGNGSGGSTDLFAKDDLQYVFQCVASQQPYQASVILNELLHNMRDRHPEIVDAWDEEGLTADLKMLVDHSLMWVPLRGLPGERRVIEVGQDTELLPQPFLRWKVGTLTGKKKMFSWMRWRRAKRFKDPGSVLDTGTEKYGMLARRVSFSVLGERLAQPLAWMPIGFDFPTIYTRRCATYHFELVCPNGVSPRGVKVAIDRPDSEGKRIQLDGGEKVGTRAAHVYLPGGRSIGDVVVRATVGVGRGAFPILWFLMGVITAAMLWTLAAVDPTGLIEGQQESKNEIAAGILLIVPALLGAMVIGSEEGAMPRLISGARILLLIGGLSAAAAATVLLGLKPFGASPRTQWTACAAVATVATVPLATSWVISLRAVWGRLKILNSPRRQYFALFLQILVALALVFALGRTDHDEALRTVMAISLLLMTVPLILLASNRLAVPIDADRYFVSLGAFLAALVCLVLGCVELQATFDSTVHYRGDAEDLAALLLIVAFPLGYVLRRFTMLFSEKDDEIDLPPPVARAMIAGKRVRELRRLRPQPAGEGGREPQDREEESPHSVMQFGRPLLLEAAGGTAAGWSSGLRSTVDLPAFSRGEFDHFMKQKPRYPEGGERGIREQNIKARLRVHMDALFPR